MRKYPMPDSNAPEWAHTHARACQQRDQEIEVAPTTHPRLYKINLPAPEKFAGATVFILDTNRFAGSNGTAWRYLSDETVV